MWLLFSPQEKFPKNPSRATMGFGVVILGNKVSLLPEGRKLTQADDFYSFLFVIYKT